MEALQNKGVAILLCVLMIACSCLAGTGISLRQLRQQSEEVLYMGSDGGGLGLQHDLRELAAQCYNVTVVAQRYLPEDDPRIAAVLQSREALLDADSPKEKHRAAEELTAAAAILGSAVEIQNPQAQDLELLHKTLINIDSTLSLTKNNSYNASAAYFNKALRRFPANILGPLTGVAPLELYE